jgi:pimeloyl-ACP methyl ester carboxylesterase
MRLTQSSVSGGGSADRERDNLLSSQVSFDSGGQRCTATFSRPDAAAGPLPCVVMGAGLTLTRRDGIPGYASRFAALAFDYRHWGDSDGQPRCWVSIGQQLADWRAALARTRALDEVDPDRVAVWGMSLGGGHALTTAAVDLGVAAVVALVPAADGRASVRLRRASPPVAARAVPRALREVITGRPCPIPAAGPPGGLAALDTPEALPGFERLTTEAGSGWRNEVNPSMLFATSRYRPVAHADRIRVPALLQLGEHDDMVPAKAIEETARRIPGSELLRYPMGHFGCFWPEHIDRVAGDQISFLRRRLAARAD